MKILFLGGSSYVGQQLIQRLSSHDVTLIHRSTGLAEIDRIPSQDVVMNLVVDYGRNNKSIDELIRINVDYPFERIKRLKFETLINFSTALDESVSAYATSKKQLERKLVEFSKSSGSQVLNLHIQQFYGPGVPAHNFVAFLLTKMQLNEAIPLTDGQQLRDFIFIDDLLDAICLLIEKRKTLKAQEVIQIGSGTSIKVAEFVKRLKDLAGSTSELQFGAIPRRPQEPLELKADISQLQSLGWQPKYSLIEGMKKTIS